MLCIKKAYIYVRTYYVHLRTRTKLDYCYELTVFQHTLLNGINLGPTFITLEFIFKPYSLIKGLTFIKFWNFFH